MIILWTQVDQQAIKPISGNRIKDFDKIAEETQINDLSPLMGFDFFQDIIQNSTATWNASLLAGGTYTYNSLTYVYSGLKYALAYFFYARYIEQSGEFDTFSGMVKKNMQDSEALDIGTIKNRMNTARKTANLYWQDCDRFILANSANFPYSLYNPINRQRQPGCCDDHKKVIYL
jgi:hypothetical protein